MDNGHDNDAPQNGGDNSAPQPFATSQPPVAPQGIFSSPELSVNSENLEELKPELSDDNKSRIAAAFSRTDATQQHDQLSEQMAAQDSDQDAISGTVIPAGGLNNNPRSNMTTSTATGDIQLGTKKKKSRAPLLIAAAVAILAVVGGVVWMLTRGGSEEATPPNLAVSDVVNFANYSLAEDGQQILANGYTNSRTYRLEYQIRLAQLSGESNIEYFNDLSETFSAVYSKAQNIFSAESTFTSDDLTTMRDQISVIRQFVSGNMLTAIDISSMYLAQGNSMTQQSVETEALKYEALEGNSVAQEYAAIIRETAMLILINYEVYEQYGCIENGAVDAECVARIPEGEIEMLDWGNDRITEFIYNAAREVERNTFTIYWSINETIQD